jgi:lipopolysaccharide/colanic/teichoic acid biosynthesis glycosyltransferase
VLKRSLDIALAGLLLMCALPALAVAALLIKLDSRGSILFCQERMGRNFKRFQLFKLRTMREGGDGPAYTLGADPRITRVGRWLRWFKLDELPQLWNVLRGEMSLVGPRPVVPELAVEFNWAYATLLKVRPGLTDPATVKYCREAEMLALVPEAFRYFKRVVTPDKLRISEAYIQNANGWRDLCVMASTAKALFLSMRHLKPTQPLSAGLRLAPVLMFRARARANPLWRGKASVGMETVRMNGSMIRSTSGLDRGIVAPGAFRPVPVGLIRRESAAMAGDRSPSAP